MGGGNGEDGCAVGGTSGGGCAVGGTGGGGCAGGGTSSRGCVAAVCQEDESALVTVSGSSSCLVPPEYRRLR